MPRRRPPGAGPALSAKLVALNLLLALPWISTAAQQQQSLDRAHGRSPSEGGSVHTILPPKINDEPSRNRLDTAARKRAFTHIQAKDERAVGTYSSAPAISAVGAQYGRDAADSGVLTPGARSIDDWTIEDFMLLATVDGHIHARNRYNGMQIWELDVGKPMLETIYNTKNESDPTDGWRNKPFIWIVEPKEDGALYILSPGPRPLLQSLGLTVKQLTDDLNPYASDDPPVVYTARKESIMLVVDASTGRVTKSFSTDGYMSPGEPESCHTKTPEYFNGNQQHECKGFFNLGQTEYIVSIHDKNTGVHIATIKYAEWTSNNRDRDLQTQYRQTKDEMYLVSRYNGDVIAYDKKRSNFEKNYVFQQKLGVPVTRVFDVARKGDDNDPDPALVLLPQPPSIDISGGSNNVWLNTTDAGSWYALSEANYPAVTDGAPKASCYTYGNYLGGGDSYILPERRGLVGVHRLNQQHEPAQTWSAIAAPTGSDEKPISDKPISVPPGIPRPIETSHLTLDPPKPHPVQKQASSWMSVLPVLATSLVCLVVALWYIQQQEAPFKKWVSRFNTKFHKTRQLEAPAPAGSVPAPVEQVPAPAIQESTELPAKEPESAELPVAEEPKIEVEGVKEIALETDSPTPPEPEKKKVTFAVLPEDEEDEDLSLSRTTTIDASPSTEAVSVPNDDATAVDGAVQTTGTDANSQDQAAAPATPKKKKTHRGKRGGQKGRNRRLKEGDEIDQIVDAAKHLNEPSAMHPDEMTVVNGDDVQDVSNIKRIGKLTIDFDRLLGNGSGGTFVFEGKWNDRDVAVKRMLPQYFGLAEQEVKLLQESDLHPNVIRYFDDEKDENFLYIAVELCQASLFDLYRDGRPGSDLTDTHLRLVTEINSNVSRALHQLAEGVHHLHSLRIIHRDIKPQNILIAYPQRNQKNGPRLVISDFGLCKTLPDNMSTLIGTTGNAGTVGWKAPELILQPRDVGYGSSTGHSRESSASTDPVSQGVKRAVDIFSLGCVFFYVLTNGSHPFDDDEGWAQMREYNIKKNKASYERLSLGPDSEEPIRLISWMLSNRPEDRPTAAEVMNHPFFWSAEKRLTFLCDCSDHWEREIRDPPSPHLSILETYSEEVLDKKRNFLAKLDNSFIASLGKQRKYTGDKMLDLLRALRNKKNHYEDMEDSVKAKVGPLPDGYLQYWTSKFPKLLMSCFDCVVECGLQGEPRFKPYFPQAN